MGIKFPSEDWIKELSNRLNASESYAQAAATWEGDQIFVILPDDTYPGTAYFYINLRHGKASDARSSRVSMNRRPSSPVRRPSAPGARCSRAASIRFSHVLEQDQAGGQHGGRPTYAQGDL